MLIYQSKKECCILEKDSSSKFCQTVHPFAYPCPRVM